MFAGEYNHGVDEKGRFIVPSKFREQIIDGTFVITRGLDQCLFGYTKEHWEMEIVPKLDQLPGNKKNIRDVKRYFIGSASYCEVDKQGRCLLPANLKADYGITNELHLIGVGNKVEIWAKEKWDEYAKKPSMSLEEIMESMEELDI